MPINNFFRLFVLITSTTIATVAPCQKPVADSTTTPVLERLARLEEETAALRSSLGQNALAPLPAAVPSTIEIDRPDDFMIPEEELVTKPGMFAAIREMAWKKGANRIVPYGALWGSALYVTGRARPGPFMMYIPSSDLEGESAFEIDTRRTRLGLDFSGGKFPYYDRPTLSGKVEIDFHGTFSFENQPSLQLRHAYGELKGENYRVLAGQTSDVIAPLNTGSLNYSVGWGAGNIGFRRMQIRLDRYLKFSDTSMVTLTGSINQNVVRDFHTIAGVDPESSGWPLMEGRLGWTLGARGKNSKPAVFGVSGHIGKQGFDFEPPQPPPAQDDVRLKTWSLNADMFLPITDRLGIQGEFFTGADLSTFWGGIIQGVDLGRRKEIRSTGGWVEIWYDWTSDLHSHAGYSIDDPLDSNITSPTGRVYNQYFFANGIVDLTENVQVGVEVSSWKTLYVARSPGESVGFEFMGMWKF